MSLRLRSLLLLALLMGVLGLFGMGITQWVILPGFQQVESRHATEDAERAIQAIDREIHHLDATTHDSANLNLIGVLNASRKVMFLQAWCPETLEPLPSARLPTDAYPLISRSSASR
jgi:sensor domain CHASE-containing protein